MKMNQTRLILSLSNFEPLFKINIIKNLPVILNRTNGVHNDYTLNHSTYTTDEQREVRFVGS